MLKPSHLLRSLLCASLISASYLPARADVGEAIRQGQQIECERLGGRYSYPRCYLPEEPTPSKRPTGTCDTWCQVAATIIGLAAARLAYCKAHPDKCR